VRKQGKTKRKHRKKGLASFADPEVFTAKQHKPPSRGGGCRSRVKAKKRQRKNFWGSYANIKRGVSKPERA